MITCNEQEIWKSLLKEEEKQQQEDEKVLNQVRAKVTKDVFKDIECSLFFSDFTYDYKITNTPQGEFQEEDDFNTLEGQWVNQTTDGGYLGDDFAGVISIKIGDDEYFQYSYQM